MEVCEGADVSQSGHKEGDAVELEWSDLADVRLLFPTHAIVGSDSQGPGTNPQSLPSSQQMVSKHIATPTLTANRKRRRNALAIGEVWLEPKAKKVSAGAAAARRDRPLRPKATDDLVRVEAEDATSGEASLVDDFLGLLMAKRRHLTEQVAATGLRDQNEGDCS